MKQAFAISAICLAVASCAPGRASFTPAANPKLASQGWLDAHVPLSPAASLTHFDKSMACKAPSCGGPGFVLSGSRPLPWNSATGLRLLIANPKVTDAKLLAALQVAAAASPVMVTSNGEFTSAHKGPGYFTATITGNKSFPMTGQIYFVGEVTVGTDRMSVKLGGGTTPAKARERLRMAGS